MQFHYSTHQVLRYVAPDQVPLPEYSDYHPILQHLHGPVVQVVDVLQGVSAVDQELVRRAEVCLDPEREELPAPLGGRLEDGQGEDLAVEVEGDVAAELLGVVRKDLGRVDAVVKGPPVQGKQIYAICRHKLCQERMIRTISFIGSTWKFNDI